MRKSLVLLAALAAALTLGIPGEAQQFGSSTYTTSVGGAAGSSAGGFFGGYMPTNIVQKPMNFSSAVQPTNFQQSMMPQQQSTKVFNIQSAFRNVKMPLFRSGAPSVPVVSPGPGNPIQPTQAIKLNPVKVQPNTIFGIPY